MGNEFIHLWPCAMATAGLMLLFKCMSADQARDSVEWSIFVSAPGALVATKQARRCWSCRLGTGLACLDRHRGYGCCGFNYPVCA